MNDSVLKGWARGIRQAIQIRQLCRSEERKDTDEIERNQQMKSSNMDKYLITILTSKYLTYPYR